MKTILKFSLTLSLMVVMESVIADSSTDTMSPDGQSASISAHDKLLSCSPQLQNFGARFEQYVSDESGRVIEESSGSVRLLAPSYFRWDYEGDYPQQIIADGNKIWHYDIELEQITVKSQSQTIEQSPLSVLMQPDRLADVFDSEYLLDTSEMIQIRLVPKQEVTELEHVDLGFESGLLTSVVIKDGFGQLTLIRFSDIKLDQEINLVQFQFVPPEGVDVLGIDDLNTSQWSIDSN